MRNAVGRLTVFDAFLSFVPSQDRLDVRFPQDFNRSECLRRSGRVTRRVERRGPELNLFRVATANEATFQTSLTVWELLVTLPALSAQKIGLHRLLNLPTYLDLPFPACLTLCYPWPTTIHA
jgi:hypothetical protein